MTYHSYEAAKGHGLPHDPTKAIIAPRPVGWISTVSRAGKVNLAPYSFFNQVATTPAILAFSSDGYKHSARNAEETGEFVFNLATRPLAEAMNLTSAVLPDGEDEFELAGLEKAPSLLVKAPRVALAPAALECKVTQVIRLTALDGKPCENVLVLGQVVAGHIRREFLTPDGRFDTAGARPIGRCGYRGDYAEVTELFEMLRPASALQEQSR